MITLRGRKERYKFLRHGVLLLYPHAGVHVWTADLP